MLKSCRRIARKLSCITSEDVHVPRASPESGRARTRARVTLDIPESSGARAMADDADDGDDDPNDPIYWQDELTTSQVGDAPQPTQAEVSQTCP